MTFMTSKRLTTGCGVALASLLLSLSAGAMDQQRAQQFQKNFNFSAQEGCSEKPRERLVPETIEVDNGGTETTYKTHLDQVTTTVVTTRTYQIIDNYDNGTFVKKDWPLIKTKQCTKKNYDWKAAKNNQQQDQEQEQGAAYINEIMDTEHDAQTNDLGKSERVICNHIDKTTVEVTTIKSKVVTSKYDEPESKVIIPAQGKVTKQLPQQQSQTINKQSK